MYRNFTYGIESQNSKNSAKFLNFGHLIKAKIASWASYYRSNNLSKILDGNYSIYFVAFEKINFLLNQNLIVKQSNLNHNIDTNKGLKIVE
jgi:hypothetical protein